jgi:rhodanese-related sulfurtransferase
MKQSILFSIVLVLFGLISDAPAQTEAVKTGTKQAQSPKNVEVAEADKLVSENKKLVVLDIRTAKEFEEGHIKGAKNLDFYDAEFQKRLGALDKKQSYLVHCASGGRSAKAREMMKNMGFEVVYHLEGGMKAWQKAGKPVEK